MLFSHYNYTVKSIKCYTIFKQHYSILVPFHWPHFRGLEGVSFLLLDAGGSFLCICPILLTDLVVDKIKLRRNRMYFKTSFTVHSFFENSIKWSLRSDRRIEIYFPIKPWENYLFYGAFLLNICMLLFMSHQAAWLSNSPLPFFFHFLAT